MYPVQRYANNNYNSGYSGSSGGYAPGSRFASTLGLAAGVGGLIAGMFFRPTQQDATDQSIIPITGITSPPQLPSVTPYTAPLPPQKTRYRITGFGNQDGRGQPDPKVFGKVKMFPSHAARQITETRAGTQSLTALFNFGYGPLDISENDLCIGDKKLLSSKFVNVDYELTPGTPSDTPITLYTTDIEPTYFDSILLNNKPQIKTAGQSAVRITIDVSFPLGLFATTTTTAEDGSTITEKTTRTIDVKVEYRVAGDTTWINAGFLSKTSNSDEPVYASRSIKNLTKALYEIRLTRETAPQAGGVDECHLIQIRAYGDTPAYYPRKDSNGAVIGTSLLAINLPAQEQLNGQIDQLSGLPQSKLEHWNGTTWDADAKSSNPADCYANALTSAWTAKPLDKNTELHLPSLKAWSDFCVANDLTFNYVYDQPAEMQEVLNQICACAFASPQMIDGKMGVVIDTYKDTVTQIITPHNILKDSFEGQVNWTEEVDVLDVQFISPDEDWQQSQRPVYADGKDSTNAFVRQSLTLIGVTNKDQAWKIGRYYLAVAKLRREKWFVSMSLDYLRCQRGDKVWLSHDSAFIGLGGSRVKSVIMSGGNMTGVVLTDDFGTENGTVYDISFRLSDGSVVSRNIQGDGDIKNTFMFLTQIPSGDPMPVALDLVVMGGYTECLVEAIEPTEELTARLTLIPYAPAIYSAGSGPIPEYEPLIVSVEEAQRIVPTPAIVSAVSDENVLYRDSDGSLVTRVQVTMSDVRADVVAFEYQIRRVGSEDYGQPQQAPAGFRTFYIYGVSDREVIDIRVRAKTRLGLSSDWDYELNHTVIGKTSLPPDVPLLIIDPLRKQLKIGYSEIYGVVRPVDFQSFVIKMVNGELLDTANGWLTGVTITESLRSDIFDISGHAQGIKTFLVKAKDTTGNLSLNAAIRSYDFGQITTENIIQSYDFGALGFPGTHDGIVAGATLTASPVGGADSDIYWAGADNTPHIAGADTDLFWQSSFGSLAYDFTFAPLNPLQQGDMVKLDADISSSNYQLYYVPPATEVYWTGVDTDLANTGLDTDPYWGSSAPIYLPFPTEGVAARRQEYNFRLICAADVVQAIINSLVAIVDAPTKTVSRQSLLVSAGGTNSGVAGTSFRVITSVAVAVKYDAAYPTAVYANFLDYDATNGPLIKVYDATGTPVAGLVDVTIRGY
jgi:hypothetical protein